MERLTVKIPSNCGFVWGIKCPVGQLPSTQETIDRLAAYEDTNMTPEEITDFVNRWEDVAEFAGICKQHGEHLKEIIQAESEGRLTVLPSKPDETAKITNADFIRNMTNEELSTLLCSTGWRLNESKKCLEWLKCEKEEW